MVGMKERERGKQNIRRLWTLLLLAGQNIGLQKKRLAICVIRLNVIE